MKAVRLRCEYLNHPMGIDTGRYQPRLSWNCGGGTLQTAYRILAWMDDSLHCPSDSSTKAESYAGYGQPVWDSGKVESSAMTGIEYPLPLSSRAHVTYRVQLFDENGKAGEWSEPAFFEMGLLHKEDWCASWITGDYSPRKGQRYPVDCFRKTFRISDAGDIRKAVSRARLYITACGLYKAELNGQRIGTFVMAPGHTDYRKRIQYQTYDILPLLHPGENEITVQLADGWYRGSCGAWGHTYQYDRETRLIAQLELTDPSGKRTTIGTDDSWRWSCDGPVRFADNKDGERYDARREPSYSGHAKKTSCRIPLTASNNVAVTRHELFSPRMVRTPSGKRVLDFGQNIAGHVRFCFEAHEGQRCRLRFGEMLDKAGEFTQDNIQCVGKKKRTPLQEVDYICREGENRYETEFAIFGFRYALLETDAEVSAADFTAEAVYSDMEQTGFFESSDPLLNQFVDCTIWSAKSNSTDVPTDCPTRERHGWTGDAQIFAKTASYLFDYEAFGAKYVRDMYDWQRKDGMLPQIAPYDGVDFYMYTMNGSSGWADAGVIIPDLLSQMYGDRRILKEYYGRMKSYALFLIRRIGKNGGPMLLFEKPFHLEKKDRKNLVNCGQSYGEWLEPADVMPMKWTDMAVPHPEVSTAYTAWVLAMMADLAEDLSEQEDAEVFRRNSERLKAAYQALRKTPEYSLDTDRQAMLVRPLYMDLLEEEQKTYAEKRLIEALEHYGWRVGTGFLSTPLILPVLSDIDIEAAYRLLENRENPGWLYMAEHGATTVWESWEGTEAAGGVASLNHYSKGAVCQWLFDTMCGVRIQGDRTFRISPRPGGSFSSASFHWQSVYGPVESRWEKKGGMIEYTIEVPANTEAVIQLPGEEERKVSAGTYRFMQQAG